MIQADNRPALRCRVLDRWAYDVGVRPQFIEPGKPIQSAPIESQSVKALLGERPTAAAPVSTFERLVRTFGRPIESAIGLTRLFLFSRYSPRLTFRLPALV